MASGVRTRSLVEARSLPSVAIAESLRTATRSLSSQAPDQPSGYPDWIWQPDVRRAPDVQLLATGFEHIVHDLGRVAQVAERQVVGSMNRHVGWPPSQQSMEISAAPSARGVEDHSILRGCDPRWLSEVAGTTPRDTINIAAAIPLDVRVVDDRILAVTERDQATNRPRRMLVTTAPVAIQEARHYLQSLLVTAIPVQPNWRNQAIRPSRRQLCILRLMASDLTDERIATQLGLSERQIRSEIKLFYEAFQVQSRFSLGLAYNTWLAGS